MQKDNNRLAVEIRAAAISLGYEKCGMIPVEDLQGYAEKLSARIRRFPDSQPNLRPFYSFARPAEKHPWAKSVIVCVRRYGTYKIPERLKGKIAKYYLFDGRVDEKSPDYQASLHFERYLAEQGMRHATDRRFGLTALRWAAMKAGLGIVRKNNFFYTESGSWVYLEAWLTDRALELKEAPTLAPCAPSCNLCMRACPTKSLSAPYEMSRSACVSCLTTWSGRDMPTEPYRRQIGDWIYGCDVCQDACPHNKGAWEAKRDFPGLDEIADGISLAQIIAMPYETLQNIIQPKFWYIKQQDVWKWKVNALNAMCNSGETQYQQWIALACRDEHEKVRDMAQFVKAQMKLS